MDALAFDAVLLVGHSDGGFGCCLEDPKGAGVGDQGAAGTSESDVADSRGVVTPDCCVEVLPGD